MLGLRLVSPAPGGTDLSPTHLLWTPATPAGPPEQRQDSVDLRGNLRKFTNFPRRPAGIGQSRSSTCFDLLMN